MSFWDGLDGGKTNPIKGVLLALAGRKFRRHFNLRPEGLRGSFIVLAACLPCLLICAKALAVKQTGSVAITASALSVILIVTLLAFPILAYFLCQMLGRMDMFRPWVIVRNWTGLFIFGFMALLFGANLLGALPYSLTTQLALLLYIGVLLADIRLAQTVCEMGWRGAIFTACIISIVTMLILLAGFATAAGA